MVCGFVGAARLSDLSDQSDDGRAARNNHSGKLPVQKPPSGQNNTHSSPRVNLSCSHDLSDLSDRSDRSDW